MTTITQLKAEIKKGLEMTTLKEVSAQIEYIYSLEETYAHERVIDGNKMGKLVMLEIDLETEVAQCGGAELAHLIIMIEIVDVACAVV